MTCDYLNDEPIELTTSEVSQSIVTEISRNCKTGKIIGILGGWGSGKSSIIAGVKKIIKDNNKNECNFIEYDAWENEKFPFKLGFLEKLIAKYEECSKDAKQLKTFKQDLAELKHLKEIQQNQEYSLLNFPNALLAISIFFYPLAFDLLSGEKSAKILYNFSPIWTNGKISIFNSTYWVFFVGLFALITNYFLEKRQSIIKWFKNEGKWKSIDKWKFIFLIFISIVVGLKFSTIDYSFLIVSPLIIWSIFNLKDFIFKLFKSDMEFYILSGIKPHTESLITINKTPEPSYIEFCTLYSKIVKKIIDVNSEKNIVIVIDNIDRISSEDAKSIWASLKGMILKEHSVFVIVPIDEEQASSIFKDYANNMDEEELAIKANSFIQKTFDIIYRVPPQSILRADDLWKSKLEIAFGRKFSLQEISEFVSIFDTRNYEKNEFYASSYKGLATPRKIIKIINEVVSIEKIEKFQKISLKTKLAFVIHYNNISKKINEGKLNKLLPEDNNLTNNMSNLELAALFFMSTSEEALMITKRDEIYAEITKDYFGANEENTRQEWTWRLLSSILPSKQFETINVLINTADNLIKINENNHNENMLKYLLECTFEKFAKINDIIDLPPNANNKMKTALNKLNDFQDYEALIKALFRIRENSALFRGEKAREWLGTLKAIVEQSKFTSNDLRHIIDSSIPEQLYIKIIPLLEEQDLDKYNLGILHPNVSNENNFSNLIGDDLFAHCKYFVQKENNAYIAWDVLQDFIFDKIKANLNEYRYLQLIALAVKNGYKEYVSDFIKSNTYLNYLYNKYTSNKEEFSLALAIYSTISPTFDEFKGYPHLSSQETTIFKDTICLKEFIKDFLDLNKGNINVLLDLKCCQQGIKQIIELMTQENLVNFDLSGTDVKVFFDRYCEISPNINAYNILRKLNKTKDIIPSVKRLEFSKDNEMLMSDLSLLIPNEKITNNFNDFLKKIDDWKSEINDISETFKTAILIGFYEKDFKDALVKYLPNLIANNYADFFKLDETYINAISKLSISNQIINETLNDYIKNEALTEVKFLHAFSSQILKWLNKSTNKKYEVFVDFIIKIKDEQWLIENNKVIMPYISSSEENEKCFVDMWMENENIKNTYKDVFEKVYQANNNEIKDEVTA